MLKRRVYKSHRYLYIFVPLDIELKSKKKTLILYVLNIHNCYNIYYRNTIFLPNDAEFNP